MSDIAVRVEGLSKAYRIRASRGQYGYRTLQEEVLSLLRSPFRLRNSRNDQETIWALDDIYCEIRRGELLGIVGRNGAGKTTFLKILCRITEPTAGHADIFGRVGSLLEVGTGFHPELTGRENVFLNGAILGMRRSEIRCKFDEIVSFAEIEKFIDTPVKRYSTGMHMRLAFSVAAHLEPEILLVDEVLAVGDLAFQKKCLGKMDEVARGGRTIFFVSHNLGAVTRLCGSAILLDQGKLVMSGPASDVVKHYEAKHLAACAEWKRPAGWNSQGFEFVRICVEDSEGRPCFLFRGDEPIFVRIDYSVRRPLPGCQVAMFLATSGGLHVLSSADSDAENVSSLQRNPGNFSTQLSIPAHFLAAGLYVASFTAHLPLQTTYDDVPEQVRFEVSRAGSLESLDSRKPIVAPLIEWQTEKSS
ncbi:MAG: ABC transporter ATP-binding protein [Acidobacteria bacterium]|nr:ABC transporter ATP-binding protein [Acidobacteriota bacterium]